MFCFSAAFFARPLTLNDGDDEFWTLCFFIEKQLFPFFLHPPLSLLPQEPFAFFSLLQYHTSTPKYVYINSKSSSGNDTRVSRAITCAVFGEETAADHR